MFSNDIFYNKEIIHLKEVDSTSNYIKRNKTSGKELIVIAECQTSGRGRFGRSFLSDEGGLYFSFSFTPDVAPHETLHYTALAALAVNSVLRDTTGGDFRIKWPNDIYFEDRKIVGILTEAVHNKDGYYLVFGIGINVSNKISESLDTAASIKECTDIELEKTELMYLVIDKLETLISSSPSSFAKYISAYEAYCLTLGKTVRAEVKGQIIEGEAVGVDEKAFLLIKTGGGGITALSSGEATLKK